MARGSRSAFQWNPWKLLTSGTPRLWKRRLRYGVVASCALVVILVLTLFLFNGTQRLARLDARRIELTDLPWAMTLSCGRMFAAYIVSLVVAFALGLHGARSKMGERWVLPVLDILQSVPVIGFFPAAISFFIGITHGHRMGVEFACIFLIFTSQAWNLAFAVYESIKSLPRDTLDAIESFGVTGGRRFWFCFVPASIPRLVYNSILSWSNGWFFLVACEIIAVGPIHYQLPGIGSFLAQAAEQDQIHMVFWGLLTLTLFILALDFFVWRPLSVWSERFKHESANFLHSPANKWNVLTSFRSGARWFFKWAHGPTVVIRKLVFVLLLDFPTWLGRRLPRRPLRNRVRIPDPLYKIGFAGLTIAAIVALIALGSWLQMAMPALWTEIPGAIFISTGRLIIAMFLSLLWVIPLTLAVWNRPGIRQNLATIAQIGASLPATALFPLIILLLIKRFGGGMEMASVILLLSGMQWYLLFNCLSGTAVIPQDLKEATASFGLDRWATWRRLVLPGIRPALVTGALTAWGGGWNALVMAEYVQYRGEVHSVHGIGALMNQAVYELGDSRAIFLCVGAMVVWIIVLNFAFWRPVYRMALERYRFES